MSTDVVRTVTKRRTTDVRRSQIIDVARRQIIKQGSEHLTIRGIAEAVGITEGAIYRHFKSKKDILCLLMESIESNWLEEIMGARSANHSPLETLDVTMRNRISTAEQRRGVSFQVIAEIISLGDRKLDRKASGIIGKYVGALESLLADAVKSGELKEDVDMEAAALLLFGMVQGLVNTWVLSGYDFDLKEKYVRLWNTFCRGVVKS